ncbi:MAG: PaaI family thioesterase [Thermoanaerobaculia bacterium]|nr:PaaI family thioesterase [Thermoanaerobaculia bacterium]
MTPQLSEVCLQERFAPASICFGCGPANAEGLHVRSFTVDEDSDEVVARWRAEPRHQAFEGVVNGGIIGTLLDCHSNWAAAWHLKRRDRLTRPPVTVTASFEVRLRKPTPIDRPVELHARATASEGAKVQVEAELTSGGEVTATCIGRFVAVKPDHPAYHGWPTDADPA